MVEIFAKEPSQTFEKVNNPREVYGFKSCKSMRTFIETHIRKARKNQDITTEAIATGFLEAYNHFHPINKSQVEIEGWHGESTFEIIKGIDRLTIIKHQKDAKDELPHEVRVEVGREELISIIEALKFLKERDKEKEFIPTRELAFQYCLNMNIKETSRGQNMFEGDFWSNFFRERHLHYKFTLILNALDKFGLIKYRKGLIELLNKDISIQMIL